MWDLFPCCFPDWRGFCPIRHRGADPGRLAIEPMVTDGGAGPLWSGSAGFCFHGVFSKAEFRRWDSYFSRGKCLGEVQDGSTRSFWIRFLCAHSRVSWTLRVILDLYSVVSGPWNVFYNLFLLWTEEFGDMLETISCAIVPPCGCKSQSLAPNWLTETQRLCVCEILKTDNIWLFFHWYLLCVSVHHLVNQSWVHHVEPKETNNMLHVIN